MPDMTAKSRLVFIGIKGLPPDRPGAGGGEREADAKARRLAARGYDVTVYCRRNFMGEEAGPYEGVKRTILPSLSKPGLEMLSHTLLATLHTIIFNTGNIVNYHGMGNALFLPLLRWSGKRSVIYMDGVDWERPKWGRVARLLLKWGAAAAFRWGDLVYVDNVTSAQRFAEIYGRKPEVITLGADLWAPPGDEHLAELGLESEKYLLFVGMLRPDKGVHLLIEAYGGLDTDLPLVIVGDNPDDPEYVRSLKEIADSRVRFVGYQYGSAARQLYANCLIYIQPSIMEGNSPSLMSAMACGRCVVVNGIEQNRETIGEAGIAFKAGDSSDLAHVLDQLLRDQGRIQKLGCDARHRIDTIYNWETVIDRLEDVFTTLSTTRIRRVTASLGVDK